MKLNLNQSSPLESILQNRINHVVYKKVKGENFLIPSLFMSFDRKGNEGFFFYILKKGEEFHLSDYSSDFDFGDYFGELNSLGENNLIKLIPYEISLYSGGESIKSKIFIHSFQEV